MAAVFCQPVFSEQVDLLILYDDFTAERYNGAPDVTMNSWIDNANAAYLASNVDIQLNLVGLELHNPVATDMSGKLTEIRNSTEVARLRDQYGADFVALIAARDGNICGIGNLAVNSRRAFNVTGVQCGYLTLIHELGHNMGLGHSRRQGSRGVRYGYALGYGVDNEFATVMAYPQAFSTRTRLNRFSDPGSNCDGIKCGVDIGNSEEADAHTALNNVRFDIASFRDSVDGNNGGGTPTPPTPVAVPAPSNLIASAQEQDIRLVWQDNSTGENYFEIQRSRSADSGFSRIATQAIGSTSYTDANLGENQTYYYRVLANVAGVDSVWSNTSSATTVGTVVEVAAPSNLNATPATIDSVNVTWSDSSVNEDFFAIERSKNSDSGFAQVGIVGRGNSSFVDQSLEPDTYYYRVRASKEGVVSSWAATTSVTLFGNVEPSIPLADGTGLNLFNLGFRVYTNTTGSDARGYITADGQSVALINNLWAASTTTFEITASTVFSFDYSSDVSGEIHGIGMEEDSRPSQNRIFKLGGTQNWGIDDFQYTGDGATQHFDIPVGQYYANSGAMRLVIVNDNDAGSGNVGYFSNIRLTNDAENVVADQGGSIIFGMEYVDDNTAILFHQAGNQANVENELCLGSDCAAGVWNDGRFERVVDVNIGKDYLIEFRVQEDHGQCSASSVVSYEATLNGQASSPCFK